MMDMLNIPISENGVLSAEQLLVHVELLDASPVYIMHCQERVALAGDSSSGILKWLKNSGRTRVNTGHQYTVERRRREYMIKD